MTTRPIDYYQQRYGLPLPHPEVVDLLPRLVAGHILDLGCGEGANSLYLNAHGYNVTAWDDPHPELQRLQHIIHTEQLGCLDVQPQQLNQLRFNGRYQAIISVLSMMRLQPAAVSQLIADMQAATEKHGFNLIICPMSTPDAPCPSDYPFAFSSGELSHHYRRWHIIHYNEHFAELPPHASQDAALKLRFATLLAQKASIKNL